jgi:Protein of unknown function (DUF2971)
MPLFKYVTLDRIDILVNQEIRYTQLGAFNDPFEMPVFLEKLVKASTIDKWFEEGFPDELVRDEYEKLSNEVKNRIPFNMFVQEVNKHKHLAIPPLTHFLEQRMPEFRETIKNTDQYFGVLSLTETPDNLLMWSHYSGQHTGMVIDFDESHSIFDERKSPKDFIRHLQQVIYSDTRPILDTFEDFSYADYMLTKSTEWSYEKEWRIAKTVTNAKRTIPASPFDICLFDMPSSAIKRVILGARVSAEDVDRVKNILQKTPHLRHIRLQQASLDERRFALNFSNCS